MMSIKRDDGIDFVLYRYIPSLPLAIISVVVFGLLTLAQTYRMFRTRSWFCVPFIIGGLFETIGYTGRAISHSDKEALPPFIIQSLLLLLAPALFAASIYMTLGRIIVAVQGAHLSVIPIRRQTLIFVCGDVLAFMTQSGGGSLQASGSASSFKTGEKIILGGLGMQILFFGFFVVCSTIFHLRCRKNPTPASMDPRMPWQQMIVMLYTVSMLILVRSVFRIIEYSGGNDGYLLRQEWPVYALDALLMAITMLVFLIRYPATLKDSVKAVNAEGYGELHSIRREGHSSSNAV
jgi:RTA1 like protein